MDSLNSMGQRLKEIIAQINAARHEAEEANRLKSVFLANLSHEIRTPMNAIIGFSAMLHKKNLTEEQRGNYIICIRNNSLELLSLISDLLDISVIEAHQTKIQYRKHA